MPASEKLRMELAAIQSMPREELVGRWIKAYGHPSPKGVKRALLERAAAWHLQAKDLGGMSVAARRMLRASGAKRSSTGRGESGAASVAAHAAKDRPVAPKMPPVPGTRLLREWNGRMHVVEVLDSGFLFDGKSYRSLTAVARRITGTHRSGPGFFGL